MTEGQSVMAVNVVDAPIGYLQDDQIGEMDGESVESEGNMNEYFTMTTCPPNPTFKLDSGIKTILNNIANNSNCQSFLQGIISRLGSQMPTGMTVSQLLQNVGAADFTEDTNVHINAITKGNTIHINPAIYNGSLSYQPTPTSGRMGNGDQYTVYLHEVFHLSMSSVSGQINDTALYNALPDSDKWNSVTLATQNAANGLAFASHCGPNVVSR